MPIDLRQYKTAKGAAERLHAYLRERSAEMDQNPDNEVLLREYHGASGEVRGAWEVAWEGGPWEWAICLSLGESMYWSEMAEEMAEMGHPMKPGDPQLICYGSRHWLAEPQNNFTLVFFPC